MNLIKKNFQKMLAWAGLSLAPLSNEVAKFDNFANLALAYEHLFDEMKVIIPENKTRTKLLARLSGTPPTEAYFIIQALAQSKHIKGDICEFGVAQGETSALIANEIMWDSKVLHLFDSFEGLSSPSENDQLKDDVLALGSMDAYAGKMSYPADMVRARLKALSFPEKRFILHKGFIEDVLITDKTLPKEVSFAYVDFDFYEPIKSALSFLDKVTQSGSIIIVDDYDYFSTGSKEAVDEFIRNKNLSKPLYDCFVPHTRYGYFAILTKK
jgi:O-methyltransferase